MSKKILGLDLGTNSIGWALIEQDFENKQGKILGMGSRIIPLSTDDKNEFSSGNAISKNQKRTIKRTQRKGYDRYQLRRKYLQNALEKNGLLPGKEMIGIPTLELWGVRAKAIHEKISLPELGRVLLHLNQKRGYKSSRSDANLDKKDTEYVAEVKNRHEQLKAEGMTIGQKFYAELKKDQYYRIKQQVFPREAYIDEFDKIMAEQQKHYASILNDSFVSTLRNEIIYYQRKLKSQKGLVNVCEFEGKWRKNKEDKSVFVGPKVAPKSSPLSQATKIWENINSISLKNKRGESYQIPIDKKIELFTFLENNERLSQAELFKILGFGKSDSWYGNKQISKGIQGNITKTQLLKFIDKDSPLLAFNLQIEEKEGECHLVDRKTGEVLKSKGCKIISEKIEKQPLYQLWHTIYSIQDIEECKKALCENFGISKDVSEKLANLDFSRHGFSNKSSKSMRKILPFLMGGYMYSDAVSFAGYNHSNSLTKEENKSRQLLDALPNLSKNSLRQPVVEKILNQLINVTNAIIKTYGRPDEIRIELARELKQSKDERNETFAALTKRERENETIRKRLQDEYGIRATRNNVIKWRLFHEINNTESKANATCIYCGKTFGITDALNGSAVDVEHIIPRSLLFDDSQSNKTLSHRSCNTAKDNQTAYDYILSKGENELSAYIERVDHLYKNKIIGKAKRDKLLMPKDKIPKDFIERQLRETQYIAKKAKELLEGVCYNVWSTSGSVTEYLRRIWGWDDVLMNLQLPKYREIGLTQWKEWETNNGQKHKTEVIKNWSKRDDHRHHAIDALTIACTQQGFIQRINKLSADGVRDEMYSEIKDSGIQTKENLNLLGAYILSHKPFSTKEVEEKAAEILISFKAGKRVATIGKKKIKKNGKTQLVQTGIIVPRGPLSEESVYGKIKTTEKDKPLKYLFENPNTIFKPRIKQLVKKRLEQHDNDPKRALASIKKNPIYLNNEKTLQLEYGTCYKEEIVYNYPVSTLTVKDLPYIVDNRVRQIIKERLEKFNNREKEAFKNLDSDPVWFNQEKGIKVKTVRMFTGLSAVEPIKIDNNGKELGFVKPGNNHHIAIYIDENGKKQEHICSFWHAVERKKYGIPVIIQNPTEIWNKILENQYVYPQSFLEKLPFHNWKYLTSMQENEMFVFDMDISEIKKDKKRMSDNLYRFQKTESGYKAVFRHHLATTIDKKVEWRGFSSFNSFNGIKVRLNCLGEIITVED